MATELEHANVTVEDPKATAAWMEAVFGWHIRWQGPAINGGYTVHVGTDGTYLALFSPAGGPGEPAPRYSRKGALNHLAVTVDDLAAAEAAVKKAGFTPVNHADYEPGRRFYFLDGNGIEFEAVQYDD